MRLSKHLQLRIFHTGTCESSAEENVSCTAAYRMNLPLVVAGMFGDVQKEQKRLCHVTYMFVLCNHDAGFALRVSPRMYVCSFPNLESL